MNEKEQKVLIDPHGRFSPPMVTGGEVVVGKRHTRFLMSQHPELMEEIKRFNDKLKCPFCNGEMIWQGEGNASSIDINASDTDISSNYICDKCGRHFEVFKPND
jgi:transcription elongation factor Elf1